MREREFVTLSEALERIAELEASLFAARNAAISEGLRAAERYDAGYVAGQIAAKRWSDLALLALATVAQWDTWASTWLAAHPDLPHPPPRRRARRS